MPSSQDLVAEIRSRAPIAEVVGETVALRRQGRRLAGLCPFHSERTPSFSVDPERGLFYCFGCQAGGDVFAFVMRRDGIGFRDALVQLAERTGVTLPEETSERHRELDAVRRVLEAAAAAYEQALSAAVGKAARDYLDSRQIGQAARTTFRLGYAPEGPDWLLATLRKGGFDPGLIMRAGLAQDGRQGQAIDRLRHRLVYPIRDRRGQVVGFGGRALESAQQPKYLNSPETELFHKGRTLYDLTVATGEWREGRQAVLVEGYMDVIALHQAGVKGAVASLGTALTEEQVRILAQAVDQVVVAYDADAAGEHATSRGLWLLAGSGVAARVVRLPAGEDPDSVIQKGGKDAWTSAVDAARRLIDALTDQALEDADLTTPRGKRQAAQAVLPGILQLRSPLEQNEEIQRLSQRLGVEERGLWQEARKLGAPQVRLASRTAGPAAGAGKVDRQRLIEEEILRILVQEPERASQMTDLRFETPGADLVVRDCLLGADPARNESAEAAQLWARISVGDGPVGTWEALYREWLGEGRKRRLRELQEQVRQKEAGGEPVPASLLKELSELKQEDERSRHA